MSWKASLIKLMATLAILIAANETAFAQELWQGASYGMTPAQVKQVIPDATETAPPTTPKSGVVERLHVDEYAVGNDKYRVAFYFLGEKLDQIALQRKEANWHAAMLTFDRLAIALRSKYGPEISSKTKDMGTVKIGEANWQSGRTNISLVALGGGDAPATLSINYQVRVAQEADKL